MKGTKFTIAEAAFERSPGQDGEIYTGDLADERHGGPITVGTAAMGLALDWRLTSSLEGAWRAGKMLASKGAPCIPQVTSEPRMHVFTFVCLMKNEVSTAVDVQVLPTQAYRAHARGLLAEHASAEAVEVWRDNEAFDRIERGEGLEG